MMAESPRLSSARQDQSFGMASQLVRCAQPCCALPRMHAWHTFAAWAFCCPAGVCPRHSVYLMLACSGRPQVCCSQACLSMQACQTRKAGCHTVHGTEPAVFVESLNRSQGKASQALCPEHVHDICVDCLWCRACSQGRASQALLAHHKTKYPLNHSRQRGPVRSAV